MTNYVNLLVKINIKAYSVIILFKGYIEYMTFKYDLLWGLKTLYSIDTK